MRKEGQRKILTQQQILKRHHRFLRQSDSESNSNQSYERSGRKKPKRNVYEQYGQKMAKKYYSKLFKQYALVDLSRFQSGQIGCRWRTEKQVIMQKGEKMCGSVSCNKPSHESYQMNFGYLQEGVKKNALVKVAVCQQCAVKLNYKKNHKRVQKDIKLQQPLIKQAKQRRKDNDNK